MKRNPLDYLISNCSEKKIKYYINEYDENSEDEEQIRYNIKSLQDLDELYNTLDANEDYSNWFIV